MKDPTSRTGLGASSILLIIVVLCLTAFAVLTLVSARVDAKLTERTIEAAKRYYLADASAQQSLNSVDAALLSGADPAALSGVERAADSADSADSLRFTVPMDDGRGLSVELAVTGSISGKRYRIQKYALVNMEEWRSTPRPELIDAE